MDHSLNIWEKPASAAPDALLKTIKELELLSGKRAHNLFRGDYASRVHGTGLQFREARKYVYGESIRQIDWNMTARMNEPYVRVFDEERQRDVFLVLDVSASMHTGWQERRKIEFAVELAASMAFSVVEAKDRLGFVAYADSVKEVYTPESGRKSFFHTISRFYDYAVNTPCDSPCTDLRSAVHMIQQLKGRRFMIFVISDFIDYDIPEDLKYLNAMHDVMLIHVYDPFEYKKIPEISFYGVSAEGRSRGYVYSPGSVSVIEEKEKFLAAAAGKLDIGFRSFSSAEPVESALKKLYAGRKGHGKSPF